MARFQVTAVAVCFLALAASCSRDLGIERKTWYCDPENPCASGWSCVGGKCIRGGGDVQDVLDLANDIEPEDIPEEPSLPPVPDADDAPESDEPWPEPDVDLAEPGIDGGQMDDDMVAPDCSDLAEWDEPAAVEAPDEATSPDETAGDGGEVQCTPVPETCNGIDDDCDGLIDETCDHDHDGVCDAESCTVKAVDKCPTVFDPGNDPEKCGPPPGGLVHHRSLVLGALGSPDGSAPERRTGEPVEIPLRAGLLDDSIVACWPMDKIDGPNEVIDIANGIPGVVHGATVGSGPLAAFGGSLLFTGGDDWVDLEKGMPIIDNGLPFKLSSFTLMAWVSVPFPCPDGCLAVGWGDDGQATGPGGYALWIQGDKLAAKIGGKGTTVNAASAKNVTGGPWHHAALVAGNGTAALYLDGEVQAVSQFSGDVLFDQHWSFAMGRRKAGNYFTGMIDDVVVVNGPLAPGEVMAIAASQHPFGAWTVPDAQGDLDDVRVTEASKQEAEHLVPAEVIGVREHSDSACPKDADPATFADRDDLCGVVGYWRLDGNGMDVMGEHDGKVAGTPSGARGRFGDPGGSFQFDGKDDTIEVSDGGGISLIGTVGKSFTMEAWVLIPGGDTCQGFRGVVGKGGTTGCRLMVDVGCKPYFNCVTTGKNALAESSRGLTGGQWHNLAGVRDTVQSKTLLFVDGTLSAEATDSVGDVSSSLAMWIGVVEQNYWAGRIDEVLIHDVAKTPAYFYRRTHPGMPMLRFLARTEAIPNSSNIFDFPEYAIRWGDTAVAQATAIETSPDGKKCAGLLSPCTGWAGWWRFDEGSGTTAFDSTTNRRDGILTGFGANPPPKWSPGASGTGLQFNGVDGVKVDKHGIVCEKATLEAVASFGAAFPAGKKVVAEAWKSDGKGGIDIWAHDGFLAFYVAGPNGKSQIEKPGAQWLAPLMHLASVYGGEVHQAYVNGTEFGHNAEMPGLVPFAEGGTALWIGAGAVSPNYFNGMIDSVRVMERPLSPDEFLHFPPVRWKMGQIDE